ncbi:hypothetical protein OG689_09115 [Kitasatospora sp. NBC_00240]|uniref:hypothetical protein n=1 Tax=Kitasatospora sp. NBC_00240 TaxID=2903567 RepID=UPI00225130B1|nr:hypothetical protein [Kitasatospora sp. NBC_00240]MCX5209439.1 hypothetical protein [Kitasatospora sp. NBC_00240]
MPLEEKRVWIMGVVTVAAYAAYLTAVLGAADGTPLAEVPYAAALLWSVAASVVATVVLNIAAAATTREDCGGKDQRDREIYRFGERVGQSFVVLGGVAALGMALARTDPFWIANATYLAFVLSAVLGSAAKIVAYRRGLPGW